MPRREVNPVSRFPARPLEEWSMDDGNVLWWILPVCEPPYVGTPLDGDWPGYHRHWTPIELPADHANYLPKE